MTTPDEIRDRIDRTRGQLSQDVDQLTEKVSPPRIVGRQVDRAKGRASSLRDRVMGSSDQGTGIHGAAGSVSSGASGAKDAVTGAVGSVGDTVGSAPTAVKSRTQGNPLAAGLVAFGVGLVLSSLAPASEREQQLAAQAESKAKELAEPAKDVGRQMAEELKPAAQEAVEQVKSTAQDAAQDTKDTAQAKAQDVQEPLKS